MGEPLAKTGLFVNKTSGGMFAVEDQSLTTGNRFFVDAGADGVGSTASYGKNPEAPLSSLALAYSLDILTANNGDVVYLMPGHVEDVIAAATIACDIAGVSVIGLGTGGSKPTITFTTIDSATMTMAAANTHLKNIRFVCDIDAMVVGLPVTAADITIENCDFIDLGTDNSLHWITLSADADDFTLLNCINKGTATAGNTGFITMAAASNVRIIELESEGDFSAANIDMSDAVVNVRIEGCRLNNANAVDVGIEGFAAATGWLANNYIRIATDAEVTGINTVGALSLFENYQVNDDGETGVLIGTPSG